MFRGFSNFKTHKNWIKGIFFLCFWFFNAHVVGQSDSLSQLSSAISLLKKAETYQLKNLDSCFYLRKQAEKAFYKLGAWKENIVVLNRLSNSNYEIHNFNEAKILSDSAIYLAQEKFDPDAPELVPIYNTACVLNRNLGLYEKSLEYGNKAADIVLKENALFFKSVVHDQIAKTHLLLGDYETADQHAQISNDLVLDTFGLTHYRNAESFYTKALISQHQNNFPEVIENLHLAIKNAKTGSNLEFIQSKLIKFKLRLIEIYTKTEDFDEAQKLFDELAPLEDKLQIRRKAEYLFSKAFFMFNSGETDSTTLFNYLEESKGIYYDISLSKGSDQKLIETLIFQADIYDSLERVPMAKKFLNAAIDSMRIRNHLLVPERIERKILTLEILNKLLNYSISEGEDEKSEQYISAIQKLISVLRLENNTDSHKEYWAQTNLEIYQKVIKFYVDKGDLEMAFNFMEENKHNLLLNELKEDLNYGYSEIPKELLDEELRLISQIRDVDHLVFKLKREVGFDANESLYESYINKRGLLSDKWTALKERFKNDYPSYYELRYKTEPIDIRDIQKGLDVHTLLVEYFIGTTASYVCFISKDDISIKRMDMDQELESLVLEVYGQISDPSEEIKKSQSKRLYNCLFGEEFTTQYERISKLIVIPDDILNNLPFAQLVDNDNMLLIQNYSIHCHYSYRLGKLLESRETNSTASDFVGYAYNSGSKQFASQRTCSSESVFNLICSSKEVQSIQKLLIDKNCVLFNKGSDELFNNASDTKVLHLATHACLDEGNPELSRIYFNNEYITNVDLKLKNVPAELVVLSACETGIGKIIKGEGSMSLAKGFFHAGAKSTLVSLWSVDDCTTSGIMGEFYSNLQKGASKADALRFAKLNYLDHANAQQKHPYFWAGFILIGDNAPIWPTVSHITYIGIALLALSFIILLLFVKRKN